MDEINISQLSEHDKIVFKQAARIESVEVVSWINAWTWFAVYRNLNPGENGRTVYFSEYAIIYLAENMSPCLNGGSDRKIYITIRHELKHAKGDRKHSNDPNSLMNANPKCDSTEY